MARYDFHSPRLYVADRLGPGATIALDAAQAHYLVSVLRFQPGDPMLLFNGIDGEWKARLAGTAHAAGERAGHMAGRGAGRAAGNRNRVTVEAQTRPQTTPGNLHYLFSPLKRARLDYMVQKAVEMGVSRLQPAMMRRTTAERVNLERMRANAIEAAEQCGILSLPEVAAPVDFNEAIAALAPSRHLVFCDEEAPCADPVLALRSALGAPRPDGAGLAVVIGPEGGFDEDERAMLLRRPETSRIALGPRILRADTAAVAALAIIQAAAGDWR